MKHALYGNDEEALAGRREVVRRLQLRRAINTLWNIGVWPFTGIAAVWGFGYRVGVGLCEAMVKTCFAIIGLGIVGSILFGVGSVLLHPIVHQR
jgi:hypothetical protein